MKKTLIWLSVIMILVITATGCNHFPSVNVFNKAKLIEFVKSNAITVQDGEDISIVKTAQEGEYFCVLFFNEQVTGLELSVLKQESGRRYRYAGGAAHRGDLPLSPAYANIAIYSTREDSSPKESLVIIYGDNRLAGAQSYEFYHHGEKYTNNNLGEYILDIYVFEGFYETVSELALYDAEGKSLDF